MSIKLSKGIQHIVNILNANCVRFQLEYTFPDCRSHYNKPLPFDIAVFDATGTKLLLLIEYDGEQHFSRIPKFAKTSRDYLAAKERDRIKNKYCLMHKIPLYRIPFWEIGNIGALLDITQDKYKVRDKYHNDRLSPPIK